MLRLTVQIAPPTPTIIDTDSTANEHPDDIGELKETPQDESPVQERRKATDKVVINEGTHPRQQTPPNPIYNLPIM